MEIMSTFFGVGCGTGPYHESSKYSGVADYETKNLNVEVIPIDDLLDFSNEEIAGPIWKGSSQVPENCAATSTTSAQTMNDNLPSEGLKSESLPVIVDTEEQIADIGVPCDDIAELEWLSNFVEESFSLDQEYKFLTTLGAENFEESLDQSSSRKRFQTSSPVSVLETSAISADKRSVTGALPLPGRARSKRTRTGVRPWAHGLLDPSSSSMILESASAASEFSTMSDPPCLSSSSVPASELTFIDLEAKESFPNKCLKYEARRQTAGPYPIRCMHCGIQKTPQWRAGPLGPKTLCNACGVRYKSGRLLPEYRPAASPEYVPEKHSNSHKRVLEMRLQKEFRLLHQQHE
ncbi:hypothetical protein O6H91_03G010000 [Diphasiastrum complanatum]|uniref:Uncharacterized protein n=2 Tax=Diphasiastrum complanatum TaxID=34168 RepID=A0ACC2E3C2_DIPCM|nr:hypothetical protein O6H91_03G010000 [Diphasiastrum complanatum]KAJ7561003.1 hypothetical protein O6H91_03G010000 [Diphasiastrum complanatum]